MQADSTAFHNQSSGSQPAGLTTGAGRAPSATGRGVNTPPKTVTVHAVQTHVHVVQVHTVDTQTVLSHLLNEAKTSTLFWSQGGSLNEKVLLYSK